MNASERAAVITYARQAIEMYMPDIKRLQTLLADLPSPRPECVLSSCWDHIDDAPAIPRKWRRQPFVRTPGYITRAERQADVDDANLKAQRARINEELATLQYYVAVFNATIARISAM